MTWFEQFQDDVKKQRQHKPPRTGPTPVDGICHIPCDASSKERFQLTAVVERVCKRETKDAAPCYFLSCRDAETMTFSVVVWDSQWSRFQDKATEGANLTLDLRVPKEGCSAFTLA